MNTAVIWAERNRFSRQAAQTGRALVASLRRHALLHVLAISVLVISFTAALYVDRLADMKVAGLAAFPILMAIAVLCAIMREMYRLWRSGHQGSLIPAIGRMIASDLLAPERVANFIHANIAFVLFMSAFVTLKIILPSLNPFQWDMTLAEWDRVLHLGSHPYQILQPALGYPHVTKALDFTYNLWFFATFGCWIVLSAARCDSAVRQRFLTAFIVTWFLGTCVLGTFFSSVGPVFYGRLLGGEDPFQPLMIYLKEASSVSPLWALDIQDWLWSGYVNGTGIVKGISAMPSMHVATCILFILLGFSSGKYWLGWLAAAYATLIFLGSIHLAWHYAIDGYAGLAVALAGWYAAGWLVRWDRARQGIADA